MKESEEYLKVVVAGAAGRMGREVVRAVSKEADLLLVGAVDKTHLGEDCGNLAGIGPVGVAVAEDLGGVLTATRPQVLVDFTRPQAVLANIQVALDHGVRPVVGTTGLTRDDIEEVAAKVEAQGSAAVIAPNFAIGAVLMMLFARTAARYFPAAEIIELHHEQKLDAPSGTALKTAEMIQEGRREAGVTNPPLPSTEVEKVKGARGGELEGVHIHSVRMPGFVAHQEVIFGLPGQTLTIRHDSLERESFMAGVVLAIREVVRRQGLIYGLEHLLTI